MASGAEPPKKKKKQWSQKYKDEYHKLWPVLSASKLNDNHAFCKVCNTNFSISHGGKDDCKKHIMTKKHKNSAESQSSSQSMLSYLGSSDDFYAVTNAEVLFTEFIAEHNLPISISDHATRLFSKMFPDSKIADAYSCSRTKTTVLLHELAEMKKEKIIDIIRSHPFSIATDGSNDADLKQYPIVVTYFDTCERQITSEVLSVPICQGRSTGQNIFNILDAEIQLWDIPYKNLLAFGSDNANVMIGRHRGVYGYILQEQPECFLSGCPCHLIHLAAEKAATALTKKAVDDILIDIYHYLDKSTNRKDDLKNVQELCGTEQQKMLHHGCTRWLSLGRCLNRLLSQWEPVHKFFQNEYSAMEEKRKKTKGTKKKVTSSAQVCKPKEFKEIFGKPIEIGNPSKSTEKTKTHDLTKNNNKTTTNTKGKKVADKLIPQTTKEGKRKRDSQEDNTRSGKSADCPGDKVEAEFQQHDRLVRIYTNLKSKIFQLECLFLNFNIPVFEEVNLMLQSDKPLIHRTRKMLHKFMKNLLNRFVKPSAVSHNLVTMVPFSERLHQKEDSELVVGKEVRDLIEQAEFEPEVLNDFYSRVRKYFVTACEYIKQKFPMEDKLLKEVEVVDLSSRTIAKFSSLQYLIQRFPILIPSQCTLDHLLLEFSEYQSDCLTVEIVEEDRADVQWSLIGMLKDDNKKIKYQFLPQVMLGILTIPHSNAHCERVFSFVRKNHTEYRSSMGMKTAESLAILKNIKTECYNRTYPNKELKRLKSSYYKKSKTSN